MENNVEEPLKPEELEDCLSVSPQQLERLFQEHLQISPARNYLSIRLENARLLVLRTRRRIDDIAISCGLLSQAHSMTKCRELYGKTPQADRSLLLPSKTACSPD